MHCYFSRSLRGEPTDTSADLSHPCPVNNGITRVSWGVYGPSLLEQTWTELDKVTAELMAGTAEDPAVSKGYARGLAFTLSLFMMPHFQTPKDIAREAHKRWEKKKAGEEYETPGLGTRKYEPPPGDNKYSTDSPEKRKLKEKQPAPPTFTPAQIEAIKNARGVIDDKDLAAMYRTTPEVIRSL